MTLKQDKTKKISQNLNLNKINEKKTKFKNPQSTPSTLDKLSSLFAMFACLCKANKNDDKSRNKKVQVHYC